MADNLTLPATAAVVATDELAGAVHVQAQKIMLGASGADDGFVSTGTPLPVRGGAAHDAAVNANPCTVGGRASAAAPTNVSADGDAVHSWHLLNGAQCVNLTAAGTLIAAGGGTEATAIRVTIATDSTGVVSVDDNGSSLTVDGSVSLAAAIPAGTNNIGDVDVLSVVPGTGATALGKAEGAAQSAGDTGVLLLAVRRDSATPGTGAADGDYAAASVDATGAIRVTGGSGAIQGEDAHDAAVTADPVTTGGYASAAAPTNVSADGDAVRAWFLRNGAQCVNLTAAGTLVAAGGGTEATALRVTLATDSTGVVSVDDNGASLTVDGTVAVSTVPAPLSTTGNGAASTALRVTVANDSTGVIAATATGAAAHDAVVSGNPVLLGLEARTTDGTAVSATGDAVRAMADTLGKQVVLLGAVNDRTVRGGPVNFTNTTGADIIAAQGAGVKIVVMGIMVVNGHATQATKVSIRDGTTARVTGFCAALGGGYVIASSTPIFTTAANAAVTAICATTGADVDVSVWGYTISN